MTSSIPGAPGNFGGVRLDSIVDRIRKDFPDITPEQMGNLLPSYTAAGRDPDDLTGVERILSQNQAGQRQTMEAFYGLEAKRAEDAQRMAKDSAKTAFQYEMMGRIPDTIFASLAGSGQLMREGAKDISNTVMRGVEALPKPNIQARAYQNPTFRYFSGK